MSPEQIEAKELDGRSDIFFARCGALRNADGSARFPRQQPTQRRLKPSSKKNRPDQHRETDDSARAGSFH